MMRLTHLLVNHEDGITTITINRPQRANALNGDTIRELKQAVETTRDMPETRVVVITGAGDRSFVGGADINALASLDVFKAEQFIRAVHEAFRAIREHPAPVIAAINGYALGAGLELMMSCDIAIAADHAQLGMPEVKVGVPSVIECALMPHIIGLMRTRELLLTGDHIDAHEAYRIGLVNQVVPLAELPAAVRRMAQRLASNEPRALFLQKELINRWLNLPMDEAIEAGIKSLAMAYATDAPQRAIAAFRARRGKR
ncbi:MAG TPA: enoyl-CoA hydratase-related protein [Candidatus Binatia bacterium]|nr:enoyl-CoA hydratase-related protein [Candidatus Binatia bacterium]